MALIIKWRNMLEIKSFNSTQAGNHLIEKS